MEPDRKEQTLYCDGSYLARYRAGSWAAIEVGDVEPIGGVVHRKQEFPVNSYTIELYAVVQAVKHLAVPENTVTVFTDCQALIEARKKPLPIYEGLWKELHDQVRRKRIEFHLKWVKGHHKSMHNKMVDRYARLITRESLIEPRLRQRGQFYSAQKV